MLAVIASSLLAIGIGYYAYQHADHSGHDKKIEPLAQQTATGSIGASAASNRPTPVIDPVAQRDDRSHVGRTPRHVTAAGPILKQRNNVQASSAPAACIRSAHRCSCYTRQGAKLETPAAMCADIVTTGSFNGFEPGKRNQPNQSRPSENYYSSVPNSVRASRQASIAMHGRDEAGAGVNVFGRSDQRAHVSESGG